MSEMLPTRALGTDWVLLAEIIINVNEAWDHNAMRGE